MVKEATKDGEGGDINFLQEISNYIFVNKYSRFNEDLKRRETWDEAIDRLESMHLKKYSFLSLDDKAEIRNSFQLVRDQWVVPSMRSIQFGGKAIEAHEARCYNCLSSETKFITNQGVKSFKDYRNNDKITVLTHKGNWSEATVREYGNQLLNKITVTRCKSHFDVYATANHRWILKDGTFTDSLKEGDVLLGGPNIFDSFDYSNSNPEERLYWAYGYIYGDGTRMRNGNGEYRYSMVRLCGEQIKHKEKFEELGFSTSSPLSCAGDFMAYTGKYLKTPPDPEKDSPNLIKAFVAGYLEADGERNKNDRGSKYLTIQSSEIDHIKFIRNCFPVAGVYIISETDLTGQQTNFGIRPYTIKFRINTNLNNKINSNSPFVVSKIEPYKEETVWCLEVEEDTSFVFPNGLTTGNCAVRHVDSLRSFAEIFYLLLCGCGVGIGLSRFFLNRLPDLVGAENKTGTVLTYVVEDNIEGWSDSVEALLNCYFRNTPYTGRKIVFDYSRIRPKGSPLKTGGGKAPGFKGLKNCHLKIKGILDHIIEYRHQDRLRSLDAYDILMHCADAVLSGGIRRSATSVIFDKDDEDLLNAKTYHKVEKVFSFHHLRDEVLGGVKNEVLEGKVQYEGVKYEVEISKYELDKLKNENLISWSALFPQRARSNNSVLLLRDQVTLEEFTKIVERTKQFGEPGFVFGNHPWQLFNPCFEIGFIPVTSDGVCGVQFCNLTSQNGRVITSKAIFKQCVKAATIIGTLQAGYTHFPYLSKAAEDLTKSESLLGVSITGMMDNPDILLNADIQKEMAEYAKEINEEWALKIKINSAARITCVKPEGTSSLILGTGSGIHPHHARRYFRRVQNNTQDNVYKYFKKFNSHMCEPSVWSANKTDDVIIFPIEIPANAMVKADLTALNHLDTIKSTQKNWVIAGTSKSNKKPIEHNVSCTVIVDKNEWEPVIQYLFDNRKYFAAVSLLSKSGDKDYAQAPMEAVTTPQDEKLWNEITSKFKSIDYKQLKESEDKTNLSQEMSCFGGLCQIV